jgi:peptidoglycan/LPS O-acetylase OafA/YrhL
MVSHLRRLASAAGGGPGLPAFQAPPVSLPPAPAGRAASRRAPGLDGVRALAVLAVMAFHENLSAVPGGFLGVDVFFVLSGYLITDLLVARFGGDAGLGLRGFWTRRARRLLPALAAMLVTVTAAVAVLEPDQLGNLRPALLGAVTYTSNWLQALHHQSYFDTFGPLPPLVHLWSLAVEEQFYLIWPLVLVIMLALLKNSRLRAAVAWAGAAASALLMLIIYVPGSDPSLVYYGTDTHASALLVGAALALTWPLARLRTAPPQLVRRLDIAGLTGLMVLGWAVSHFSGADPAVYPAGLALAAVAAGGVVIAAASQGLVGRMLAWQPLRWLGVRSYGIYLWHWPVIAISATLTGPASDTVPVRGLETVLPIALAAGSWRWIEEPILRSGLRAMLRGRLELLHRTLIAARRSPAHALALAIPLAICVVACTAGYGLVHSPGGPTLQQQIAAGSQVSAASQAGTAATSQREASASLFPTVTAGLFSAGRPHHITGSMVTAVGDSVMLAAAAELHAALPGIYIDARISRQMSAGLQIIGNLARRGTLRPIVVVGLGTNGTVTGAQIRQLRADVGPARWLVLINTFVPRPWQDEVDAALAAAARQDPHVLLVNWREAIEHRTDLLWEDGVHPRPDGGVLYARLVNAAIQNAGSPGRQ